MSSGSSSVPSASDSSSRKARTVLVTRTGNLCRPRRPTASHSSVIGVVLVGHRTVPGGAVHGEPHPVHALLGGLDEIEPQLLVDGEGEAADLADRLRARPRRGRGACRRGAARRTCRPPPRRRGRPARCRAGACGRCAAGRARPRGSSRPCPSCRPRRGPTRTRRRSRRRTGGGSSRRRWPARRRCGRGSAARDARGPRPRSGRPWRPGPGATRRSAVRDRPRRASRRRTRRPRAHRGPSGRRSCWCRSGSAHGRGRRPRPRRSHRLRPRSSCQPCRPYQLCWLSARSRCFLPLSLPRPALPSSPGRLRHPSPGRGRHAPCTAYDQHGPAGIAVRRTAGMLCYGLPRRRGRSRTTDTLSGWRNGRRASLRC